MTPSFNLTEEPWLVCLDHEGAHRTCSLREALVEAHELAEIQGDPPVTAALLRLLIALVHRVLDGPKTIDAWAAAWQQGQLPAPGVDAYLNQWKHRFDLFSATEPFFQAILPSTKRKSPANLDPTAARGNNATLFDHSMDDDPTPIPADAAARKLVALQAFTAGGYQSGEDGGRKSGKAGMLASAWAYFVTGPTLFHTILLNTPLYDPEGERPFPAEGADVPVWERSAPHSAQTRAPAGWLDLLTYPARRIQLVATDGPMNDVPTVSWVAVTDGDRTGDSWTPRGRDQNLAFRETPQGWGKCTPSESRDLWRDADVLLRAQVDAFERPRIIEHVARLVNDHVISRELRLGLDAYALATDSAKVAKFLFWRHQRLSLRSRLFAVGDDADAIADALAVAEVVAQHLARGVAELTGRPLSVGLDQKELDEKERERRKWVARAMADFWGQLGIAFNRFIAELGETETGLAQWSEGMETAVRKVWQQSSASLLQSPEGFRREAAASHHYRAAMALSRSLREGDR